MHKTRPGLKIAVVHAGAKKRSSQNKPADSNIDYIEHWISKTSYPELRLVGSSSKVVSSSTTNHQLSSTILSRQMHKTRPGLTIAVVHAGAKKRSSQKQPADSRLLFALPPHSAQCFCFASFARHSYCVQKRKNSQNEVLSASLLKKLALHVESSKGSKTIFVLKP